MSSCKDEETLFYSFTPVPLEWSKSEMAVIELPDSLPRGEYAWDIEVRNTAFYPYRNLWLEMEIAGVKEEIAQGSLKTLHLELTDSTGRWKNLESLGTYFISTFPQENKFVVADSTYHYQVRFRHIMEDERLKGISDIGIKLKKQ